MSTGRRLKWDSYLSLHTKFNSKWIKDLNMQLKTLKILEEIIVKTLHELGKAFSE